MIKPDSRFATCQDAGFREYQPDPLIAVSLFALSVFFF